MPVSEASRELIDDAVAIATLRWRPYSTHTIQNRSMADAQTVLFGSSERTSEHVVSIEPVTVVSSE
ncbi:hypothetical protein CBOM_07748 [Ceraceosorus bombacis]|uniref:Uncharacterized protein n=1 Tax=Ceraceosorus bombacis TaxID=401625 RepID=A0A0P1BMG7_9BASI|nr:hypothetical protein CBOM_07748 [Ceraceosorus bombacis]